MILTCDSCGTKFRLDPTRLKKPASKVRCSRCGYVFEVAQPEEEELVHVDLSDDVLDTEKGLGDLTAAAPAASAKKKGGGSRRMLYVLLVLLVLAGGVWAIQYLGFSFSSAPEETPVSKSPKEKETIPVSILDTTKAYFSENSSAGQIFVVEGEVVNESKKAVSFVMLEGKVYTGKDSVAQSQRCYAGNMMTREEVARLSVSEIQSRMMNREGKNFLNVNIAAGKRVPFMIVFQNLPALDSLHDYSVEVVSAKTD
jgi:predicted Zn finger-like uncharacterized protein